MTMNIQALRNRKLGAMLVVLAVSFGVSAQSANAEIIEAPVTLTGDVIKFVSTTTGATVDATGDILDSSGNVVGVVLGPNGQVVHEVSGDKVVVVKQSGDAIVTASLYNRAIDLQSFLAAERAAGRITSDKYDALFADVENFKKDIVVKAGTDNFLTFDESLALGADLDTLATRIKTDANVTTTAVVFNPMVIVENPTKKRIAIYQRTIKTTDGVTRTTKTTTTETTR